MGLHLLIFKSADAEPANKDGPWYFLQGSPSTVCPFQNFNHSLFPHDPPGVVSFFCFPVGVSDRQAHVNKDILEMSERGEI